MALIGPRPERRRWPQRLNARFRIFADRLLVRPGITGLAQLRMPADMGLQAVREKLTYDLEYIRNIGPALDARSAFPRCSISFVRSPRSPSRISCDLERATKQLTAKRAERHRGSVATAEKYHCIRTDRRRRRDQLLQRGLKRGRTDLQQHHLTGRTHELHQYPHFDSLDRSQYLLLGGRLSRCGCYRPGRLCSAAAGHWHATGSTGRPAAFA